MTWQPQASHYIDGAYVEDAAGDPIPVIFPATGAEIARVHAATPAIIDRALASACRAQPAWAATRPVERARVLQRAAAIIRARGEELARLETMDTGKPLSETRVADWPSAAEALEYFAGLAPTVTGETIPLGGDFVYTLREAIGICVGIGAWNYPAQIAGWKGAPALAFGNAMVLKPSEMTPLSALKMAEILSEAGLPPGLYNVVQGAGAVGAALVTDPRVDKVSLTGSVATGQKVYAAAATGIRHVTMELGGKSPLIIFDDADLDSAVGAAMLANFYSAGQVCSNGTRVFVQSSVRAAFVDRLVARMGAIRQGDPLEDATDMGPLISEAQLDRVARYIEIGQAEGAELVAGGGRPNLPGFHIQPTVFAGVTDQMTIAREEIFGPVMCVLDFDTESEVVARANATEFGLASYVYTRDLGRAFRLNERLQYGMIGINSGLITTVEAPFGGVKESGLGKEGGSQGLEDYLDTKYVCIDGI
jgi:betaine-aldehyde dehydrogenase